MKQKCNALADLFMSNRQIGESQAYYQLMAHMNLTYSSVKTVVVPTVPAAERRHWLQRQDPEEGRGFKVNDKDGLFLEKADLVTKYERNIKKRIEMVLKLASAGGDPISYYQYEMAVKQQPRKGSEVLLRRDIDEVFMSNYNPEWMEAWDANHDISPVYDYFGVITYVTDYFTKVSISANI